VIQRLFATGLSLQGTIRLAHNPDVAERIGKAVDDLDLTVKHIRTAIFGLEAPCAAATGGLRERILDLIREAAGPLGFDPTILFEGPVDTAVSDELAGDLVAPLREALSNAAGHAHATAVEVTLTAGTDAVLRVVDNGVGPPRADAARDNGLRNMRARADRHGGHVG
jgi:signal transduction histidine kinase